MPPIKKLKEIIVEEIGLVRPTKVKYKDKTIITKGLDIKELCQYWKEEFGIYDDKIRLVFRDKKYYNGMKQRTLQTSKTVEELFYESGFVCEYRGENNGKK